MSPKKRRRGDDLVPIPDEAVLPRPPYRCPECGVDFERGAPDPQSEPLPRAELVAENARMITWRCTSCGFDDIYFEKGLHRARGDTQ